MKITENLPQFSDKTVILAVIGKQTARIFRARSGEIAALPGLEVETPRYSDRESFFQRSGQGRVYASGSVYESQDEYIIREFTGLFARHLRSLVGEYSPDKIYLYLPAYLKGAAKRRLNREVRQLISAEFYGNYGDYHPFTLLAMIRDRLSEQRRAKAAGLISPRVRRALKKKIIREESEPDGS